MTGTKRPIFEPQELWAWEKRPVTSMCMQVCIYVEIRSEILLSFSIDLHLFWYTESLPIWLDLLASVHQAFIYLYLQFSSDLTNLQHFTQLLYECCLSQLRFSCFNEIATLWWLNHILSIKSRDLFFLNMHTGVSRGEKLFKVCKCRNTQNYKDYPEYNWVD